MLKDSNMKDESITHDYLQGCTSEAADNGCLRLKCIPSSYEDCSLSPLHGVEASNPPENGFVKFH